MNFLNELFSKFDALCAKHKVSKVRHAHMLACGPCRHDLQHSSGIWVVCLNPCHAHFFAMSLNSVSPLYRLYLPASWCLL